MNESFTKAMKDFDIWKGWNMAGNMDMLNSSDAARMGARFIDFQKSAFSITFETMLKMQEQSQKAASVFMTENKAIPEQSRDMLDQWQSQLTQGQNDFQKYIVGHYDRLIDMFEPKKE